MAQQETEHLGRIVTSRAVRAIGPAVQLASATTTHEPSLDRILCRMAGV